MIAIIFMMGTRVENNHYFFDRMVKMVMVIGSEKKGMVGYGYGCITIITYNLRQF